MATILLHKDDCETGTVRPGDVIFSRSRDPNYPLHVGVFLGTAAEQVIGPSPELRVRSLPLDPTSEPGVLGDAVWSAPGDQKPWRADIVGTMRSVEDIKLREVLLVADAHADRLTILDRCEWVEADEMVLDESRSILDGIPLFVKGTCAQYVDYLYRAAKLEIVATSTYDPSMPKRIHPATQLHAFWIGSYPLTCVWCEKLGRYPECTTLGERCFDK